MDFVSLNLEVKQVVREYIFNCLQRGCQFIQAVLKMSGHRDRETACRLGQNIKILLDLPLC